MSALPPRNQTKTGGVMYAVGAQFLAMPIMEWVDQSIPTVP